MPVIYNTSDNTIRGGFSVNTINNTESLLGSNNNIQGGGNKTQLKNKVIPFGLAIKKEKESSNYECKNGNVIDPLLFNKLFESIAKVEKSKVSQNNKTKRKKLK
jgi:hypothetical protein